MSAEALRAFTREKIQARANEYAEDLIRQHEMPQDQMRYFQGVIAGLRESVELQDQAYKGMGA